MGSAISCAPSMLVSSSGAAKVVSTDGTVRLYARPVRAAELMLEHPGTFVCDAAGLSVGHRIRGLSADDHLDHRRYLLLPIELLYSVLTHEEMASFTSHNNNDNNKANLASFGKNILPSLGEFCMFVSVNNDNNEESKNLGSSINGDCNNQSRDSRSLERFYSKQRSWRPALETIVETPTSCRSH